jgi:hypothetical protein
MLPTLTVNPIDPNNQARDIGFIAKKGGLITVDTQLPEYFKMLRIGVGGDLLVRGIDNNIIPFRNVLSGGTIVVLGYEVVSAATVDGVPLTTTASEIDWYGGQ